MGVAHDNAILYDTKGVIYKGRKGYEPMEIGPWADTKARSLADAMNGADVFGAVGQAR